MRRAPEIEVLKLKVTSESKTGDVRSRNAEKGAVEMVQMNLAKAKPTSSGNLKSAGREEECRAC